MEYDNLNCTWVDHNQRIVWTTLMTFLGGFCVTGTHFVTWNGQKGLDLPQFRQPLICLWFTILYPFDISDMWGLPLAFDSAFTTSLSWNLLSMFDNSILLCVVLDINYKLANYVKESNCLVHRFFLFPSVPWFFLCFSHSWPLFLSVLHFIPLYPSYFRPTSFLTIYTSLTSWFPFPLQLFSFPHPSPFFLLLCSSSN